MKNEIVIQRSYHKDCTTGRMMVDGMGYIATLELPWLGNEPFVSCIPEGTYRYEVRVSPRLGRDVVWILDVEGRSLIQIHPGNFTYQIEGCILPGAGIQDINNDGSPDVISSVNTLDMILRSISRTGTILITSASMPGIGVYT